METERGCPSSEDNENLHPSSYLADLSGRAPISNQSNAERVIARCHLAFMQMSVNFVRTMLEVDMLMCQMKQPFSAEDLLHVYTVVWLKKESGIPFFTDFNDKFKHPSKDCKKAIQAINNRKTLRKGLTSSSPSYVSLEFSNSEEKEGEKAVNQLVLNRRQNLMVYVVELGVPASPISISSLNNEHSDDLAYAPLQPAREVKIVYSFREAHDSGTSSEETNMLELLGGPALQQKWGKETAAGPSKRPKKEDERDELSPSSIIGCGCRVVKARVRCYRARQIGELGHNQGFADDAASPEPLESCSYLGLHEGLVSQAEEGQNYTTATQAQNEAIAVGDQRDKALKDLTKLQAVACSHVYEHVFNRGISRVGDNYDKQVAKLHHKIFMEGCLACGRGCPTWEEATQPEEGAVKATVEEVVENASQDPSLEP
ncbi:hypothetical protein Acr_24g0006640 [Actinidia rufa]|uniref:Uncharacterized protein n=1 Tax=Actinidia rufa TaxID=165716 RepID=A0A7J0GVC7_9ERIC|nr:hypothetical protein Acr_24g0006640 [Actinidia rufa]